MVSKSAAILSEMTGVAAGLGIIVLSLSVVVVNFGLRPGIEASGFAESDRDDQKIASVAEAVFGKEPYDIRNSGTERDKSWLVLVEGRGSDELDCAMVVFLAQNAPRNPVLLHHSERQIPTFLRRLEGGLFDWATRADEAECSEPLGKGWFCYKKKGTDLPDGGWSGLARVTHDPRIKRVFGIALSRSHRAV